jgi:hypothetical protein
MTNLAKMYATEDSPHHVEVLNILPINPDSGDEFDQIEIEIECRWNFDTDSLDWEPANCKWRDDSWHYLGCFGDAKPLSDKFVLALCKDHMTEKRITQLLAEEADFAFVRDRFATVEIIQRKSYP